ncbi:MAG: hypothetical protein ACR2FS_03150 [Phormidesmis sp.]
MPLETLLKLLSAAKLPLTTGFLGLALAVGGSNLALKNVGATVALLSTGAAAATANRKDKHLKEIREMQSQFEARADAWQDSIDIAKESAAAARQAAQVQSELAVKSKRAIAELQTTLIEAKAERDQARADVAQLGSQVNAAGEKLGTCHTDNSLIAGQLETLEIERVQLIAELYETAVEETQLAANISGLEKQFQGDYAYQLGQKKKLKSEVTKARANFHTQLSEAQERIAELEVALAEKTALATQMLTELEGDANGKFTHFSGKAGAQNEVINGLRVQIEELRRTSSALTLRRFDTVGTDNIIGNRLIDALAKHDSTYGAFHHEREGHNGRLKIWLTMVDAPLKRAQDCLDDLEAELKLWAKPAVKVDRGMHLFTLATEQEHKVLAAPNVPLTRLEKTLDSAIHARIVGGSGSGKTVLLNNLMHYLAASMESANVTLLDPKAVDDWGSFVPRYWGQECVSGIVDLADGLKWRVEDTVKQRKAGKPAPEYDPELFVVDEAQYNYLLAQNADDSYVKERGETPPNFAKKAKGALAGLLSLGRAYNAIGLFVTQLPQVSKVGLNEGSFDPCVNIFLGAQIDNAIDNFLPGSGFTDTQGKALDKELATRRQLGQQWLMLVADLPRSEAYLMECPAPGYYHNRFSRDLGASAEPVKPAGKLQSPAQASVQACSPPAGTEQPAGVLQPTCSPPAAVLQPSAHCPKCSHRSNKYHGTKPQSSGKYRFICENAQCEKGKKSGTFSAFPLA